MPDKELIELVSECLARMEDEGEGALDEICRREPVHAAALRERVGRLRAAGMLDNEQTNARIPERLGDFRLVRRIAGGGMGVVYEAEQISLGRRVALKLIKPEMLYFPMARERFRREVDAVAHLSHPGIAQIHAFGEESELPYFAMEFIDGASLATALADVIARAPSSLRGSDLRRSVVRHASHDSGASSPDAQIFSGSWVEACTRVVRRVCEIIAVAHEAGVLHRDLKPSNVLLTPAGRVVVVDFGLALLEGSDRLTRTGSQLGSLPYMAPEQLRGDARRIGPATDVYALGVTLYELATLHLPYMSESASMLEREISAGNPRSMRALNGAVGRDLETVVMKALESEPRKRYSDPRTFAAELDAVLEHRPIRARRAGPTERAVRWCRRHPAGAVGIALATVIAVGIPSAWAWSEQHTRLAVQDQRDTAVREKQRAETYLQVAMESADLLLARATTRSATQIPALIDGTIASLERLADVPAAGAELEEYRAKLLTVLGDSLRSVGRPTDAENAYRRIAEIYARKCGAAPSELVWKQHLAIANNSWGAALAELGRNEDALAHFESSMTLSRELARDPAHAASANDTLVSAASNRARMLARMGRDAEWAEAAMEVAEIAEGVLLTETRPTARARAATALLVRANLRESRESLEDACPDYRRAIEILEAAVAASGEHSTLREELGGATMTFGSSLMQAQRIDEATPVLERSRAVLQELSDEVPDSAVWPVQLAEVLFALGVGAELRGDPTAAGELFDRMLALREDVVRRFPEDHQARRALTTALYNHAAYALERGNVAVAIADTERGLEEQARIDALEEPSELAQYSAASMRVLYAQALVEDARLASALQSLEMLEKSGAPWPPVQLDLARTWSRIAAREPSIATTDRRQVTDHAVRALRVALENGAIDRPTIAQDADFVALQSDDGFRALMQD